MFLPRTSVLLLSVSLLGGGVALAQDESGGEGQEGAGTEEEKVEEYVESEVEKENEQDGEAVGADPGEASYNVANCEPSEGGGNGSGESAGESDPEAIEECEEMVK